MRQHHRKMLMTCVASVGLTLLLTSLLPGKDPPQCPQQLARLSGTFDQSYLQAQGADSKRSSKKYPFSLSRDILQQEDWPERQTTDLMPGLITPVVHYLWCGDKKFRFQDYLSVLSVLRFLKPVKLIFHYTHLPQLDSYNSWFQEIQVSVPGLELRELSPEIPCGSTELLKTGLGFLAADGGVLLGENVILTRFPKQLTIRTDSFLAFAANDGAHKTQGAVFARRGFSQSTLVSYAERIDTLTSRSPTETDDRPCCVSVQTYNGHYQNDSVPCVIVAGSEVMNPRDIIEATTAFAELARWLFYGSRAVAVPVPDSGNLIPRVSHFIRLRGSAKAEDNGVYTDELSFNHMLNILSALYVAGFEQVFLHLEGAEPTGRWWEEVKKEKNVTVVKAVRPSFVYQKDVGVVQHASDVARYLLLYKYGGAYQDFDVTWTSRVPDSLLAYPAVAGIEWEKKEQDWVESFNLGVILARPGSQWFRRYIDTHKDFRDSDWGFNSLRMSYKTWELYPHALLLDRHLQVICCNDVCHPPWHKDYSRNSPTIPFSPQEVRAVHVTCPKPHPALSSPQSIREGKDMFAAIGRQVLDKSGRQHLVS